MATGYIYVTSLDMVHNFNSLKFQPTRYKVENAEDVIIYIAEETNTITDSGGTLNTHGNQYYLLSKSAKNITLDCTNVFVRGESNGARYDSEEMDFLQIDGNIFDITTNTYYSMGGSGSNGSISGSGFKVGAMGTVLAPVQGTLTNQTTGRTVNVTLTDTPSTTNFIIGSVSLKNARYVSTVNSPLYAVSNFFNKYSSKYYSSPEVEWWKDMIDLRTFYKAHQMYDGGTMYKTEFEKLEIGEAFDGFPLFLNIHTTHNLDEARKYLTDGTIPSDDTYIQSDDGEPPAGKEDSGGDDDDMDGMNNTEHTSSQSIYKAPTTHFYDMSIPELQAFVTWFWSDILSLMKSDVETLGDIGFNAITGAYSNISQYVNSLKKINVDIHKYYQLEANRHITLGRYTFDAQTTIEILHDNPSMLLTAEYRIPFKHSTKKGNPTHGAFLDYDPYTTISLYIPFIGVVPLQTNMVMGRQIRLYSAVDIYAGTIHYNVYVSTPKKEWSLIGTYEGKCGVEVPLTLDDSLGNATNVLQNVASTTVGLCTGNVSSLLNVGKSVFSKPANQVSGISTNTSYYNPNQCAIIMQTTPATIPDNFGSTVGYLYRQSAKLESLNGFTTCMNPRIGNFEDNTPTETERAEIYSLLETGVII